MNNGNIVDFCCSCGCWIAANTGTMRTGQNGGVEIICNECLALEQLFENEIIQEKLKFC